LEYYTTKIIKLVIIWGEVGDWSVSGRLPVRGWDRLL